MKRERRQGTKQQAIQDHSPSDESLRYKRLAGDAVKECVGTASITAGTSAQVSMDRIWSSCRTRLQKDQTGCRALE